MDTQTPASINPREGSSGIDPSILTTQQLWREIASLKELMFTRLESVEKAIIVSHNDLVRVPTDVQKAVSGLKELHHERFKTIDVEFLSYEKLFSERFRGVEKQFNERDVRVEQTAKDTKVAVDAALQAAEKAVGKQNESFAASISKSEAATTKQIDQQAVIITATTKALDDKVGDNKERISRLENLIAGRVGTETGKKDSWGYIVGAIGLIGGIIAIVISIIKATT